MGSVEYRLVDFEPAWQKIFFIVAVVLLGLLVPATVLGYYAEKSLPGEVLYPLKRQIESGILSIESLTPYGKTNYLLALGDTRITETSALIERAKATGDYENNAVYSDSELVDLVTSVKQAQTSLQQISDPVKKKEAQQKLASSIQKYNTSLQKIVISINEPSQEIETTPTPTPTPSPDTLKTVFPTPTPSLSDTKDHVVEHIQQVQDDLQQIQNEVEEHPESSLLSTPTLTTTPTPARKSGSRHKEDSEGKGKSD